MKALKIEEDRLDLEHENTHGEYEKIKLVENKDRMTDCAQFALQTGY
jgi:hypothetical protein